MSDHAFKAEVSALVDRVLDLVMKRQEGDAGPSQRFVIEVPDAWILMAAWLGMRRRMSLTGRHGPSPIEITETSSRIARGLAKRYIRFLIHEHMHVELHDLATGGHPFLRPPEQTCRGGRHDAADA